MHLPVARLRLLREVQEQFSKVYPYLKIEPQQRADKSLVAGRASTQEEKERAMNLLYQDMGLQDGMTVADFEAILLDWYTSPIQVYRKSGNLWLETRLTRKWSLKEQNEYGANMSAGLI